MIHIKSNNFLKISSINLNVLFHPEPSAYYVNQHWDRHLSAKWQRRDGADEKSRYGHVFIQKHKQSRYEFFTESMERLSEDRLNRELELRDAIQREQFVLHYQPQVSAKTRKMTGVEALLRMKAPDGSLKSPEAFIELAEESGLIIDIGRWVIDTAGKQAKCGMTMG